MDFVTIMVNNHKPATLPAGTQMTAAQRVIAGPCHDLADLQMLARQKGPKCIRVVTQDCQSELSSYYMDTVDLHDLIVKLRPKNYHNSLWCLANKKSPWFAADAYRIVNVEKDHVQKISVRYNYYLKLSVSTNGEILLFFSVHRDLL